MESRSFVEAGIDHQSAHPILGRDRELSWLARLVDAADGADDPKVLVLTGAPGVGKSTLVDWTAEQGRARRIGVLRVRGSEAEADLCFAAVHQLLRPLLPEAEGLPEKARAALRGAFGIDGAEAAVDPLQLRFAVAALLSQAAKRQALLLLIDDAQWVDRGSLDILSFLARRLDGEPTALLVASREESVPDRFDRDFPHLVAEPLDRAAASRLLDSQPEPPRGRLRAQILEQAAGNPLALIELARAVAETDGADLDRAETLPLTKRLEDLFAADLSALPPRTRRALLLVAAGATRWPDLLRADPELRTDRALEPAERVGLVRVEGGHLVLRHPLVRSAVYQRASFSERRSAHLALAAAFVDEPDRRAWNLAAAAVDQDETVASALADSADRARGRGGQAAAAAALERAAELTPDPETRARRLLAAAQSAMFAGYPQWVSDLAARADQITRDPVVRAHAAMSGGWALGVTLRHDDALALLLPAAERIAAVDPGLACGTLAVAATSVYNSGTSPHRSELLRIYDLLPEAGHSVASAWALAGTEPHTRRRQALELVDGAEAVLDRDSLADHITLGAAAWILDRTEAGARLLGLAMDQLRRAGASGTDATAAQALALARFEGGAWAAAHSNAEDAMRMAAEAGADNVTIGSRILLATLQALRGDHGAARSQALAAVQGVDLRASRSLHVRYRHALGLAAMVEGDHVAAYEQLRSTFTRDFVPAPIHYHASVYCLGDLAGAAVRVGRAEEVRAVLKATEAGLGPDRSPRVDAIMNRAAALLSETDSDIAERYFLAALEDPACTMWPFEHALVQLDFGEWLRRRRRTADARPRLGTALEIFERLDARPWSRRAASELRVAGGPTPAAQPEEAGPDARLTLQERQIAELAAQGLTNRDIAAQLYLSPRTVGYHLHKIFPKLGVRNRAQLRDALTELPPATD
ncbi:DNA-binding CsgD family transcriptional regulator [Catenulispora sp. MAP5-51]|uniref:ATP-binding protein n=1 Tax=Catenulispora sp. MAP5-51 TaxID=3156298 RepID=UPI003515E518